MTPRTGDLVVTRWGARLLGRRLPCAIGRGGIRADKREGDGATPRGVLHLTGIRFRTDRITIAGRFGPIHLRPIRHGDVWSDDSSDPAYNHGLNAPSHSYSHERMHRGDRLYDLVGLTDWNWPNAKPGKGSAIFLHRWRKPRHPTEGCIAFSAPDLAWVLSHLSPHSRIIVTG